MTLANGLAYHMNNIKTVRNFSIFWHMFLSDGSHGIWEYNMSVTWTSKIGEYDCVDLNYGHDMRNQAAQNITLNYFISIT